MKKCEKCGYESQENKFLSLNDKKIFLCSICKQFIPDSPSLLQKYLKEKIDWKSLESFRTYNRNKNIKGMERKASQGNIMSRAPFGYNIENKELVPDKEKKLKLEEIFRTFLEQNISLNSLAKKFGFSVNGIKKILKNFTYIGKVKFKGQVCQGKHQAIISAELFNKVQNKLENLGIK